MPCHDIYYAADVAAMLRSIFDSTSITDRQIIESYYAERVMLAATRQHRDREP